MAIDDFDGDLSARHGIHPRRKDDGDNAHNNGATHAAIVTESNRTRLVSRLAGKIPLADSTLAVTAFKRHWPEI